MHLANSFSRLGTETAFEVLARARALEAQGREILHLEIGEPDFDTPANVRAHAIKAINEGWTHYTAPVGLLQTRAAVAEYIKKTRGINVDPEEIIITPGGKSVIFLALMVLLEPGDEVICPDPSYPIYGSLIEYSGAKPVFLPIREADDFRLDVAELEKRLTPKTRLLVLNSPANPTGGFLEHDDLERIAKTLARFPDVMVLSDEIYSRILYGGRHHSIAEFPGMKDRTIILDGLSKTYAMTGWRIGYAVAPRELITAMARLANNCHSCAASFAQIATIEALLGPQDAVDAMVAEFRRRRDVIVAGLNKLPGFSCRTPQAAFYAFPNITKTGARSSKALADFLLADAGVACLAGTAFGPHGEGYLRFSYATSIATIEKALAKIAAALPRLPR